MIKKRIVPVSKRKAIYGGTNQRRTLTVHQTGNTAVGANADVHAWLQYRGYSRASWHYQSDDKEIIQSFPTTVQTHHAGDGRGNGNLHSISWEICINRDGNYLKSLQVAAKGIAQVLKEHNLNPNDLRQHYDWSKKNCPAQIRAGKDGVSWAQFKRMVQAAYGGQAVSTPTKPSAPSASSGGKSDNVIAREVLAGKWGNGSVRTSRLRSAGYNPDVIQSVVNQLASGSKVISTRKSNSTIAKEVLAGKWGNGADRISRLRSAGYDPTAIQSEVNKVSRPAPKPTLKSTDVIAREVMAGKWGNGSARTNRLNKAGYDPSAIQRRVNQLASGSASSTPKPSASAVANDIIAGRGNWGTGNTRINKLKKAGYNPSEVQRIINSRL